MKAYALLLLAPAACALSWSDLTTNVGPKIPGESPIELCGSSDESLLKWKSIDVTPNPPQAGKALSIKASGNLDRDVTKGSYAKLTVKYGLINLISTTADLCEQAENINVTCPVKKGTIDISAKVDLPAAIPPGTYSVTADVYDADDESITCLKSTVTFKIPGYAQQKLDV